MLGNGPAPRYIYDGNALRYTYMLGMLYYIYIYMGITPPYICILSELYIYIYIWGKAQRCIFMLCIYIYGNA